MDGRAGLLLALLGALALAVGGCGGDDSDLVDGAAGPAPPPLEAGESTVRIPGKSGADVAGAAILAQHAEEPPKGWLLVRRDDWRTAILAAQFAAAPVDGAVMPIDPQFLPTATQDVLRRIQVEGFPESDELQVLVIGGAGRDVFQTLTELDLRPSELEAPSAPALADTLYPFRAGFAQGTSSSILVVSSEHRDYALSAAAWSAFSGDTIAFVTRDGLPDSTRRILSDREEQRAEKPTMYVIGPPEVISEQVVSEIGAYGGVHRVAGPDPIRTAVELANFGDRRTAFGWRLPSPPSSVSIVNAQKWEHAIGAFTFSAHGPRAPILLIPDRDTLPGPVREYLRELAERGSAQAFVFGDQDAVSSEVLAQIDQILAAGEREPAGDPDEPPEPTPDDELDDEPEEEPEDLDAD